MISEVEVIGKESYFTNFSSVIWKAVSGEVHTCCLERALWLTIRSTLQYGVKKSKVIFWETIEIKELNEIWHIWELMLFWRSVESRNRVDFKHFVYSCIFFIFPSLERLISLEIQVPLVLSTEVVHHLVYEFRNL